MTLSGEPRIMPRAEGIEKEFFMEFNDVLYSRQSIRAFTDKRITKDEVTRLLDSATQAPSACNMQSWHFFAITDADVIKRLADAGCYAQWVANAPLVVVICTDGNEIVNRFGEKARDLFILQDTAAATENMLLAATNMGYGGCWIGSFNGGNLRKELNIDDKYNVVAVTPIGEPAEKAPKRGRKPLNEVVTFI